MVVLLYLKKQEETAHYIIHIMWYRGEYMGCENLAGMKFAHLLVLKRDEMKKAHIPTGFVNVTAEPYVP